jgi:phosphatidylglycerol---prolipoprotein diacylglyceryl transferase
MIEISWSSVAFYIGDIGVTWYGILMLLAITVLVTWVYLQSRHNPIISTDRIWMAFLVGIVPGIIFARLVHVIDQWGHYSMYPDQIIGGRGLAVWGAVIGASLGIWLYFRIIKAPAGAFFDIMAPGIVLAQIIGRVGCTANGCCYGTPTDLSWGIFYTHPDSVGFATLGTPVHPAQVYEMIFLAIVFGVLLLSRRRLKPDGSLYLLYLSLYSVWRIGIGFLRDNGETLVGLQQAQIIAFVVLAVALPLLVWRMWRQRHAPVAAVSESPED